jgi:hypothetical protein
LPCSDNQAARNCITKAEAASPVAKTDPYLRLTHANIIMNMLPKGRYSNMKDAEKAKHNEYITKVCMDAGRHAFTYTICTMILCCGPLSVGSLWVVSCLWQDSAVRGWAVRIIAFAAAVACRRCPCTRT